MLDPFHDLQPSSPVWVNQEALSADLQEKRGVADPDEPDLAWPGFGESWRGGRVSLPAFEKGGEKDFHQKIPLTPATLGSESHLLGMRIRIDSGIPACRFLDGRAAWHAFPCEL
jgi:hypothetical protein